MTLLPSLISQLAHCCPPKADNVKVSKGGTRPPPVEVQLERVMETLDEPRTQRDVCRLLKISEASAYKYLAELRDLGKVSATKTKINGRSYLLWEKA